MSKKILAAVATSLMLSSAVIAQTPVPPATSASPAPSASSTPMKHSLKLTDAEAKRLIGKTVYTSDNKDVGDVAAFARDQTGTVNEMHADIGGFLGFGETRVRVTPAQFKLAGDRVELLLTSQEVKSLPKVGN